MGGYKTVRFRDTLPDQNRISPFYDRLRRLSDVLAQREDHFPLGVKPRFH